MSVCPSVQMDESALRININFPIGRAIPNIICQNENKLVNATKFVYFQYFNLSIQVHYVKINLSAAKFVIDQPKSVNLHTGTFTVH